MGSLDVQDKGKERERERERKCVSEFVFIRLLKLDAHKVIGIPM